MTPVTAEEARVALRYEPGTGLLFWRELPGADRATRSRNTRWADTVAGTTRTNKTGNTYVIVNLGRVQYLAHRLIWLMETGEWPDVMIDHEDGDGTNNRWGNLREATATQNVCNRKIRKDNPTGFKGVRPHRRMFEARITVARQGIYLGLFNTAEEAARAYDTAARIHQGAFAAPNFTHQEA